MDASKQVSHAIGTDPKFAAEVVRDIDKIEQGYRLAEGPMSERIMDEVADLMSAAAEDPWNVTTTDYSILLTHPNWKPNRPLGRSDMWFEFTDVRAEDDEATWIAAAVASGEARLGLELGFRMGLQPVAKTVLSEKGVAADLQKIGLAIDRKSGRTYAPTVLNRDQLAKGFSETSLSGALSPVSQAFEKLLGAKKELDALLEKVRDKAKAS